MKAAIVSEILAGWRDRPAIHEKVYADTDFGRFMTKELAVEMPAVRVPQVAAWWAEARKKWKVELIS